MISNSNLDVVPKRGLVFLVTFVFGLVLALVNIGRIVGWNGQSFSFETAVFYTRFFISLLPVPILFFPIGLLAYFPEKDLLQVFCSGWVFYFATSLFGIVVQQQWVFRLLYTMFVIVLILNIAGCGPIATEILFSHD